MEVCCERVSLFEAKPGSKQVFQRNQVNFAAVVFVSVRVESWFIGQKWHENEIYDSCQRPPIHVDKIGRPKVDVIEIETIIDSDDDESVISYVLHQQWRWHAS